MPSSWEVRLQRRKFVVSEGRLDDHVRERGCVYVSATEALRKPLYVHRNTISWNVACNRAVSLSARLKTSGAPERRDLPVREGHVRRCVPGNRVMSGPEAAASHPLSRRPMRRAAR